MQVITTVYEPGADQAKNRDGYKLRTAARAVVTDSEGRVALLHVTKFGYHKLPGGGVEPGEDERAALGRELLEEIGCTAEVQRELGTIVEFRDKWGLRQESHCYAASQFGVKGQPDFTQDELAEGFEIVWLPSIDAAIAKLEADQPRGYEGPIIQQRDLAILRAALATF